MATIDRVLGSLPDKGNNFLSFSCFFPPTSLVLGERNHLRSFLFSCNDEFPSKRWQHQNPRWRFPSGFREMSGVGFPSGFRRLSEGFSDDFPRGFRAFPEGFQGNSGSLSVSFRAVPERDTDDTTSGLRYRQTFIGSEFVEFCSGFLRSRNIIFVSVGFLPKLGLVIIRKNFER